MRLLFFGDSLTYGQGLADCSIRPEYWYEDWSNLKPSNIGQAALVAKNLGIEYINLSKPGASNMQIHWEIKQFNNFQKSDFIVIQWSYENRDCILSEKLSPIGPWHNTKTNDYYYLAHDNIDIIRRNILIIEHTALLLEHNHLNWIFFSNAKFSIESHIDKIITDYESRYVVDLTTDDHPGILTNQIYSNVVLNHIKHKQQNQTNIQISIQSINCNINLENLLAYSTKTY